jgi:hypothetical protein
MTKSWTSKDVLITRSQGHLIERELYYNIVATEKESVFRRDLGSSDPFDAKLYCLPDLFPEL